MYRKNKFFAKKRKCLVTGQNFDSTREYNRYWELRRMEEAGLISDLETQPKFEIIPKTENDHGQKERPARFTPDFRYMENGVMVVEDVKSKITAKEGDYILRRKLLKMLFPSILYRETL